MATGHSKSPDMILTTILKILDNNKKKKNKVISEDMSSLQLQATEWFLGILAKMCYLGTFICALYDREDHSLLELAIVW